MYYRDITERKGAEELTKQNEIKYRNLFDNQPDYCFAISSEGKVIDVNNSALSILGYKKDELVGNTLQKIYAPESLPKYHELFQKWLNTGKLNNEEMIIAAKTGEKRKVLLTANAIRDSAGRIVDSISVQRDITEQKILEEQLQQSQKMEAIGTLTGGIAHDFNNLLTIIMGNTNIAMNDLDKTTQIYKDLKEVSLAAGRASSLTRQLLLYSRKEPMGFYPININNAINNLFKMLERLISEDIKIKYELEPDILSINADLSNVEQVIINICINARDAMPKGGVITIRTENIVLSESQGSQIENSRLGSYVRLSIADTGIGMDKNTIKRIFEPFYTTKGMGKGTGLGLSVVYGIIKVHNGWINVYSEPGHGSVFKVYLPTIKHEAEVLEDKEAETKLMDLKGKGEHILVVEDDEQVLAYMERILLNNNYNIQKAVNSEKAVEIFKVSGKDIALVITDMILSDGNGLDTIARLKLIKNSIGVIVCSGYLDDKTRFSEIREKGYEFIQKPFEATGMLRVIRRMLDGKK